METFSIRFYVITCGRLLCESLLYATACTFLSHNRSNFTWSFKLQWWSKKSLFWWLFKFWSFSFLGDVKGVVGMWWLNLLGRDKERTGQKSEMLGVKYLSCWNGISWSDSLVFFLIHNKKYCCWYLVLSQKNFV